MTQRQLAHGELGPEAAPLRSIDYHGGYGTGTSWGAILFTVLVASGLIWGASQFTTLQSILVVRQAPAARAIPAPSVAPTVAPTPPAASSLASAWVTQSAYPVLSVGGTATVSVTFRNAGTATWIRGTPSEVKLGTVGSNWDPAMSVQWPAADRPAVQNEAVVPPGQVATFTFQIKGVSAGKFTLPLRPVVDVVGWLNDEGVYVAVDVR